MTFCEDVRRRETDIYWKGIFEHLLYQDEWIVWEMKVKQGWIPEGLNYV